MKSLCQTKSADPVLGFVQLAPADGPWQESNKLKHNIT